MTTSSDSWAWMLGARYSTCCLTLSHGLTPADVLGRYGADPATARSMDVLETYSLSRGDEVSVLRAGVVGGWAFCIELFGVQGTLSHTLERLSFNTDTLSVMCAEGQSYLEHWRQGRQLESFELGTTVDPHTDRHHSFRTSIQRRTTTAPERPALLAAMDVVSEHIDGLVISEAHLNGPLLSAVLPWDPTGIQPFPPLSPQARSTLGRCLGALDPTDLGQAVEPHTVRNRGLLDSDDTGAET